MQNKTIKFFISSTFKDFIKERNALQNFVFPRLKKLCQKKGFSFQPVDLRWGITVESSEDNKTMEYCLNEVRRCSYDPKPNLLILFGQRYGWGPLPSDITIQEWDYIKSKVTKDELVKLENWYIQDLNDIDRKYFLKDKKGFERKEWEAIEKDLKNIIQNSTLDNKDEVGYSRFYKSATELEIIDALEKQYKSNSDNTIVYNRKFNDDINEDLIEGSEAKTKEEKAKAKEIQNKLKKLGNFINQKKITNMYNSSIDTYTYKNFNDEYHPINKESYAYPENMPEYLKDFCEEIYNKFETKIEKEIKSFNKNFSTLLEIELDEQERFLKSKYLLKEDQKNKRKQVIIDVIGRNNEVEEIKDFVIDTKSKEQYYLLYGKSGTGKTSVMAKALTKIKDKNNEYNIYYRFIGTTAKSSFSRQVFETLYWEIESQLKSDKKISQPHFEIDDIKFKKQFKELLQRLDDKKVVIFLDSIDQFEDDNDLSILLDDLPKNIKIVFSVLYDENKTDNNDYTKYYERLSNIKNFTKLDILDQSFNFQILKQLLEKDNRTLSTNEDNNQQNLVESFIKGQTPLCVKLTYEIVREWTSNKNIDGLKEELPSIDGENKEEELIIKFFNNVIKKHYVNGELLNLTLGLISASKDGLSETELIDIISNEEKILKSYDKDQRYQQLNKLPDAIFSKMYYHIQDIFTEKLIDGEMLINPYHRIIEEVIKDNFYKNNKNQLHKKLSDYFYLKQDKNKTWNKRYHNLHMLNEYPYQLFHSKQSKELKEILFDLEFTGSIYDNKKQNSFRDIMSKATQLEDITEDEIYPWESFYREKEHLILKVDEELWRPHQSLFQLAYEDGLNSFLHDKAKDILKNNRINFLWSKRLDINKYYKRNPHLIKSKKLDKFNIGSSSFLDFDENTISINTPLKNNINTDSSIVHEIILNKGLGVIKETNREIEKTRKYEIEDSYSYFKSISILDKSISKDYKYFEDFFSEEHYEFIDELESKFYLKVFNVINWSNLWKNSLFIESDNFDNQSSIIILDKNELALIEYDALEFVFENSIILIFEQNIWITNEYNIIDLDNISISSDNSLIINSQLSEYNLLPLFNTLDCEFPVKVINDTFIFLIFPLFSEEYIKFTYDFENKVQDIKVLGSKYFFYTDKNGVKSYNDLFPNVIYDYSGNNLTEENDNVIDALYSKTTLEIIVLINDYINIYELLINERYEDLIRSSNIEEERLSSSILIKGLIGNYIKDKSKIFNNYLDDIITSCEQITIPREAFIEEVISCLKESESFINICNNYNLNLNKIFQLWFTSQNIELDYDSESFILNYKEAKIAFKQANISVKELIYFFSNIHFIFSSNSKFLLFNIPYFNNSSKFKSIQIWSYNKKPLIYLMPKTVKENYDYMILPIDNSKYIVLQDNSEICTYQLMNQDENFKFNIDSDKQYYVNNSEILDLNNRLRLYLIIMSFIKNQNKESMILDEFTLIEMLQNYIYTDKDRLISGDQY